MVDCGCSMKKNATPIFIIRRSKDGIFICNLVRVVQSPRFYMSLFLTLLCMSLGNFLAFNGIYKIEGLSIFAASSIRGFSPISLVAALICTLPYSSQIIEDAESHFLTAQLCRISKKKYLAIVGSTVIISSFLVFFLPIYYY